MGRCIVFFCLLCLLLVEHSVLSPPRRGSKKAGKVTDSKGTSKSKISSPPSQHPGQLTFGGNLLELPYNLTEEEYQIYASNYTLFPDKVYYPWVNQSNISGYYEIFLTSCLNTTMTLNTAWVNKIRAEEDVYMSVGMHVLRFICSENYGKSPNKADLLSGGLLITTVGVLVSFVMQRLG